MGMLGDDRYRGEASGEMEITGLFHAQSLMPHLESQLLSSKTDMQLRELWKQIPNLGYAHSAGGGIQKGVALSSETTPSFARSSWGCCPVYHRAVDFLKCLFPQEYIHPLCCEGVKRHRSTRSKT